MGSIQLELQMKKQLITLLPIHSKERNIHFLVRTPANSSMSPTPWTVQKDRQSVLIISSKTINNL